MARGASVDAPAKNGDGEGGSVMHSRDPGDDISDLEDADTGGTDGTEDAEDQTPDDAESVEGEGAVSDPGTEGAEDAGDGGADAEGDQAPEGSEKPSEVAALRAIVAKQQADFKALQEKINQPAAAAQKPMTDEDWAATEQEWGGMPRGQIQRVTGFTKHAMNLMEQKMNARFAKYEKAMAIDEMAATPEFRDIKAHMAGVNEFLKNFDESEHSDPALLKLAYGYALGTKAKQTVKKVANAREVNKRIVGPARPHMGGTGGKPRTSTKLTQEQREAARLGGMSEQEYIANMPRRR